MNKINPKKLLLSKWTAVAPKNKERHFIVTKLIKDKTDSEKIIACEIEAVLSNKIIQIDWHDLKDNNVWQFGWK